MPKRGTGTEEKTRGLREFSFELLECIHELLVALPHLGYTKESLAAIEHTTRGYAGWDEMASYANAMWGNGGAGLGLATLFP